WGTQLSASSCVGKIGSPVVNINEKVVNDVDSGLAGNWAIDSYNRHIQVWQTGAGWDVSGVYTMDVLFQGSHFSYTLTLVQSGNTITGTLLDPYLPGTLSVNGTLTG